MADDTSLLLRIRGDSSQAKTAIAETKAAVASLRQSFGPELTQTVSVANKAFSEFGNSLNVFVGQRVPLVGGAFVRVTQNLRGLGQETEKQSAGLKKVASSIDELSKNTGKSIPTLTTFLTNFAKIEGQAGRDAAAIKFFGAELLSNNAKIIPATEQTAAALSQVAAESEAAGAGIASIAGPIGIAIVALAAEAVAVAALTKEIFELTKASADYQGKLFDLSQQTGVSVETLSALEVVARTTGSSIDTLTQSLGIFQRNLEQASEDTDSKAGKAFRRLGVDVTDTEQALRQTIAALARMPEGFRQTAAALEVFGRGGKAFLAIAKEANGDIDTIIDRLKGLGLVTTEQAKLADEFNDQVELLSIELRGLGTEAIPVVLDVIKDLRQALKDNRDIFLLLQGVVKGLALAIGVPLKAAIAVARIAFEVFTPVIRAVASAFESIRQSIEFIIDHPLNLPGLPGGATSPTPPPRPTEPAKDPFTKSIEDELAARKRLQGVLNAAFEERKRQAEESIALAQREFEAGRINREQFLQATLLGNRKKAQAEIDALEVDRKIKLQERALAKDDFDKQTQLSNAILAIDSQIANKRSELRRTEQDLTAKSQLEERKDLLAHQQAQLEILTRGGEQRIAFIERDIRAGVTKREEGLRQIEEIENAALVARGQLLKRELDLAGAGPSRQSVLDKIATLENERTELERRQSERRISIAEEEAARTIDASRAEAETLIAIGRTTDASRTETLRALAAARIRAEEDTERAILKIRFDAIDREDDLARIQNQAAKAQIEARLSAIQEARRTLETQLNATGAIQDPTARVEEQTRIAKALKANVDEEIAAQGEANKERDRLDKELNNQLRVNNAERKAIQGQGERDIEEGRQKDLDNERRYADELRRIRENIRDTEQDTAREVIRLMRLHFASRKSIIEAELKLELDRAAQRHDTISKSIQEDQRDVDARIKFFQRFIDSLKAANKTTGDEYQKAVDEMAKANAKKVELHAEEEAELQRSEKEKERILREARLAAKDADPIGRLTLDIDSLKEFAAVIEDSIVPLGQILTSTFQQVSDAIGQTVANWVLLGETGPAVMRKILAQALASVAAEAAVNAIKELALGFATLFFNPAESAAHFTAAALWGSIAGVAAVAGRGVAGDLFKQKPTQASSPNGSSSSPDALNPIVQGRNQAQTITIILRPDESAFGQLVKATVVKDYGSGGVIREVINSDGR